MKTNATYFVNDKNKPLRYGEINLINPKNTAYHGAVHKNIKFLNNSFNNYKGFCIRAKATNGITIIGNSFKSNSVIKYKHCSNVQMED